MRLQTRAAMDSVYNRGNAAVLSIAAVVAYAGCLGFVLGAQSKEAKTWLLVHLDRSYRRSRSIASLR